jgi:hypothetical protein
MSQPLKLDQSHVLLCLGPRNLGPGTPPSTGMVANISDLSSPFFFAKLRFCLWHGNGNRRELRKLSYSSSGFRVQMVISFPFL